MLHGKNIDKLDIIKIKNFNSLKDTVKKLNLQITDPINDLQPEYPKNFQNSTE